MIHGGGQALAGERTRKCADARFDILFLSYDMLTTPLLLERVVFQTTTRLRGKETRCSFTTDRGS